MARNKQKSLTSQEQLDMIKAGATKELIELREYLTFKMYRKMRYTLGAISEVTGINMTKISKYSKKYNEEMERKNEKRRTK